MINRKVSAVAQLWVCAVIVGACVGGAARANATTFCPYQPPPGVCSYSPGVPGFTPGFTLTPDVPGTWGPTGIYTPIQGDQSVSVGGTLP